MLAVLASLAAIASIASAAPGLNRSLPLQLDVMGMKTCRGVGDPHYSSFDNGDIDALTRNDLFRMHGTYLMVGTCGSPSGSPLTVWLTTTGDGTTEKVEVSTLRDGAHLSFTMSGGDFSECYIGEKYDMPGEFDECQQDAADHGIVLVWNSRGMTVASNDVTNSQEWKVVGYPDGQIFSSVRVDLRESVYKRKVRGTCGDMNTEASNDGYCWNPSIRPAVCWDQRSLMPEHWWRHGHCPSTCPQLYAPLYYLPAEAPMDASKEAAALNICRVIVDTDGPYKGCLSAAERERYAKACVRDEVERVGAGCVVVRDLAGRCEREGSPVDLARTPCLAHL